ncbi:TetR/AcrR family transcriptional regulator [Streptomyces sp. A012304]|uniref:TetR/AcrR family transcriptional regulator n=1 Tax=Streptomyces sp. A012304 TaxID=375446 RepID=UPI00223256CF|nr:TetR/AcrR family transcriptional regulator [Streptomyces sp. A012304]GKQ41822.1 TetR family transcriptional regulator [Streptomyces sp. A012304]
MPAPRGRTGRPPLTDERKAEIRLEIARAAVDLFVDQGVTATTGEQIGQAVGVSARTVWRYFPSKESCVSPLFSAGIDVMAGALRRRRPGRPLAEAFAPLLEADQRFLVGPDPATLAALIRLTRAEPGLRAVWLQTYDEAEPVFARALAEAAGLAPDDPRAAIQAAMFNAALRTAVEHYAWRAADLRPDATTARTELADALRLALAVVSEGMG